MAPSGTPLSNRNKPSVFLLSLIIGTWLILSAFAFWWFEWRYWGSYSQQLIQFDSQAVTDLYPILMEHSSNQKLVVHFTDDNCPCESYRSVHVDKIKPMLASSHQINMNPAEQARFGVEIPATPAVAIWDEDGQFAYFGPYSSGMTCGAGLDFIALVFSKLASGVNPSWLNTQGYGCFCAL